MPRAKALGDYDIVSDNLCAYIVLVLIEAFSSHFNLKFCEPKGFGYAVIDARLILYTNIAVY